MGRKRQSTAEEFIDLVALMPWWAGIALAVISYIILHRMAAPPVLTGVPVGEMVTRSVVSALASAGQYVVPFFCALGALGSVLRRKQRAGLFEKATASAQPRAAVAEMSWREFEMLVGEAYRLQGYSVVEMGGNGPDGGVDLVLRRGDERFFIQCKHWKTMSVGVAVVRELFGVMSARGAKGGAIVTAGSFTPEARKFAAECNVQLVDGMLLPGLLQQARALGGTVSAATVARERANARAAASAKPAPIADPACPTCGSDMVRRTARKGANSGAQFWGCSRYPACRGTR